MAIFLDMVEHNMIAVNLLGGRELLEAYFAAFKAGLTVVDARGPFSPAEMARLYDRAEVRVVLFDARLAAWSDAVRACAAGVRRWIAVPAPGDLAPSWAEDYWAVLSRTPRCQPFVADWDRSPDDYVLLFSAGARGAPSSVKRRQDALFRLTERHARSLLGAKAVRDLTGAARRAARAYPPLPERLPAYRWAHEEAEHAEARHAPFTILHLGGPVVTARAGDPVARPLWDEPGCAAMILNQHSVELQAAVRF